MYVNMYRGGKSVKKKKSDQDNTGTPKKVNMYRNVGKNKGGVLGGIGYAAGRAGVDFLRVGEGVIDAALVPVDLLHGNVERAKSRFQDSVVDDLREKLDKSYNPGKGMQVVGDITGGLGQSVGYGLISAIPYAGKPMMYSSIVEQSISSAAEKTGKVGLKEIGYGVTMGGVEGVLESKLGAGVNTIKGLGSAILKKTGREVVESAAKTGGETLLKTVLKDAAKNFAGEFAEEAISEAADPLVQRAFGIDKNAKMDLGSILYAGVIGGVSGGILGGGTSVINYKTAVNVGREIQRKGLDTDLIKRAKYTLSGFDIANERAETMKMEKPTGDVKETKEQKKQRVSVNKKAKYISKQSAELASKIQENVSAYEQLRADPRKANSDAAAAALGELRGNLFMAARGFEVDTVEAFLKETPDTDRQLYVDAINEQLEQEGKTERYSLADFDADKDDIRRGYAGKLTLEELMGYAELTRATKKETGTAANAVQKVADAVSGAVKGRQANTTGVMETNAMQNAAQAPAATMMAANAQGTQQTAGTATAQNAANTAGVNASGVEGALSQLSNVAQGKPAATGQPAAGVDGALAQLSNAAQGQNASQNPMVGSVQNVATPAAGGAQNRQAVAANRAMVNNVSANQAQATGDVAQATASPAMQAAGTVNTQTANAAQNTVLASQEAAGEEMDPWAGMSEGTDPRAMGARNEAEVALIRAAINQGVPRNSVQDMLTQYRKGTKLSPAEFAEAWSDGANTYGRFGFDTKGTEKTAFGRMEPEAREAAMRYGRDTAEAETRKRDEAAKAKKKPSPAAKAEGEAKAEATKKAEGRVIRGKGVNVQSLSDAQYTGYKAAEILSKAIGGDIVIEASIKDTAGRATYGFYDRKTNTIHININALRDGKHVALYTLGHEVTHYIKEWSPAKFKVLSDFVMERMSGDAKDLIDAKFNLLRGMEEYKDYTVTELNELAAEEVVADGMELILTDGKVLEELAREDETLWKKIRDWVMEIIGQIRRSFESLSGASKTAKVLKETMDSLDEIERLFTEGVKEAGERTRTAGVETKQSRETRIVYSKTTPEIIDIQPNEELTRRIESSNGSKYDAIREYLIEKFYGQTFTMSDGRTAIMDKRDAKELSHKANNERTAQLGNLRKIVEKATYNHTAENVDHPKFVDFHYYATSVRYNGEVLNLWINVGVSKYDGENHIYAITNREETPTHYGVSRPVGNAIQNVSSENSIPQYEESVNTFDENSSDNLYSLGEAETSTTETDSVNRKFSISENIPSTLSVKDQNFLFDSDGNQLSEDQQEYFKDSKIRNVDGKLLVVYHGTNVNRTFYKFRINGGPIWFTPALGYARAFTNGKGKVVVYKAYLNISNPLYIGNIDYVANDESLSRLSKNSGIDIDILKSILVEENGEHIYKITNSVKFKDLVKEQGYDGLIAREGGVTSYAVFEQNQIKKVDNKHPSDDPDIRYSLGEETADVTENAADTNVAGTELTDREMLLAMAEQLVGSEEENKIVSNYKAGYDTIREKQNRIDGLTDRQRELQSIMFTGEDAKARSDAAKELRTIHEEMNTLLEDVADADRKLTEIEGMKVIRNLIQRERLAVRDTYQTKYKTMYERKTEAKATTEVRRSVRRLYNRVNRLLFSPTKTRNVPVGMQSIVAEALRAANVDAEAIERLGQLEEQLAKLEQEPVQDLERMADLEQQIAAQEQKVGKIKDQVSMMIEIFEATNDQNADGETRLVFDETVLQKLKDLRTEIGNASIRNMDRKQLQALKDFYDMIWHRIKVANNTLASNRKLEINKVGEQSSREVRDSKALKILSPKSMELVGAQTARKYIWSQLKPLTAFEVLGSDTFMSLFREVLNGEDVWARDLEEAFDFIQKSKKKHKYDDWDMIKRQKVETAQGSVDLSLSEIMSLYAYSFREQAKSHLMGGGFVLDPNATARVKGKKLTFVELERRLNNPTRYTLTEAQIRTLGNYLTEAQRAYVEEVQGYLTGMGEKGNQVSRKLYGIDIFREQHYFPIKVKSEYLESQLGKTGDPKIKNRGMTKEIVPEAKNPLVLQDFMAVTGDHINSMATYHAFVLPVEDLTRVLNFKPTNVKLDADGNPVLDENGMPVADDNANVRYDTLKSEIEAKYGAEAVNYIEQLLRDLNGGARRDAAATLMDQGLTAFKRAATMMSLSTIIQQPTSVFRAMAYVDPKWFKGAKKYDYEIVKKYAPVAVMKEIGGFDTGTGMRTTEYLNKKEYKSFNEKLKAIALPESKGGDPAYRAEAFGWLTGKADEITWSYLFGACVNEQAAKLKKPASSEEVLKAAGERFADVVRRTQVYDSTLTRNQMMRSKDTGAKLLTQFGAEPATVVSMIVDGLVKKERGDKSFSRKTGAVVAVSIIVNAMASSLIYAMRDDDEDKNFLEKYISSLTGEIIEGFNPLEYLPFFRDIMSLFKGYDVERSDMTLIGNLFDQIELITSSNRSVPDKLFGVSGAVASFFGVPITNVYRDVKGIVKTTLSFGDAEPRTGGGTAAAAGEGVRGQFNLLYKILGVQEGNAYELYKAALRGDTAHYNRVAARYETASDAEQALRRELRENDKRINQAAQAKLDGDLDVYESIIEKIEGEGHFDRNLIIRAINNEVMSIKDAAKQATATKDEIEEEEEIDEALYSATDLADALERGDTEDYESIYEYLIAYKTEQGQTEAQARASIKSSMTAKYRKLYLAAWARNDSKEMKRILALLQKTGLYGTGNDTAKTVEKWVRDANK